MAVEKKFLHRIRVHSPSDLSRRWYIAYYDTKGKRHRKYGCLNSLPTYEARIAEAEKMVEAIKATLSRRPYTIRDQIYEELQFKRGAWRKKTYQTFKSKVDIFFEWHGKEDPTPASVKAFFSDLLQRRHNTTYNDYITQLKSLFVAIGKEALFKDIRPVRNAKSPSRYFQSFHVQKLKRHISAHDPQLWLFIQFIYYCFIRPGELRWLKASDILLDEQKILLRSEISKNRKQQFVAIPAAFLGEFDFLMDLDPRDYIFPSKSDKSKPIGNNTMARRHRLILKKLGFDLKVYSLYSWKHTGAVRAAKSGIGLKQLQLQLRHHSLDQVDEYLRQMGVQDLMDLQRSFPAL